jgi:hypothetical protein
MPQQSSTPPAAESVASTTSELSQAEDFDEIEDMARSLIAVSTDAPVDDIGVRIAGDVEALLEVIEDLRDRLSVHEAEGVTMPFEKLTDELGIER